MVLRELPIINIKIIMGYMNHLRISRAICDLFMYNLCPDYLPKGEKERGRELKFIESLLCYKRHSLHIFSSIPHDNMAR